jgi:hypothetical protein
VPLTFLDSKQIERAPVVAELSPLLGRLATVNHAAML